MDRNVPKYMDDLSQFFLVSTWTICHNFILNDLSQVIYLSKKNVGRFVTSHLEGLFVLDDISQTKEQRSGEIHRPVWTNSHNCF